MKRAVAGAGALLVAGVLVVVAARRPASPAPTDDAMTQLRANRRPRPTNLPPAPPPLHAATPAGIALGRALFYDPRLSGNGRVSCATCHDPARAFSDGVALGAAGVSGARLARHAPVLFNLAWAPALFWDGGAKNLESLMFAPILHADEMGGNAEQLAAAIDRDPALRAAYDRAFPGDPISTAGVMRALAQYLRSLVSADSRYDRFARGEPGATLTAAERRGVAVHRARCASCHASDLFTDHGYHDIGLDPPTPRAPGDPRRGRARVSFDPADEQAYRTPSLRNLGYSAPYMHDGRHATLDAVLAHYRRGPIGAALTDADVRDLRAFLATLDDPAFVRRAVTARTGPRAPGR